MDDKYVETGEATQEALRAEAQARVAAKAFPDKDLEPGEFKTLICDVCDDELPLFRMQKGLRCCTACQTNLDRASKLGR